MIFLRGWLLKNVVLLVHFLTKFLCTFQLLINDTEQNVCFNPGFTITRQNAISRESSAFFNVYIKARAAAEHGPLVDLNNKKIRATSAEKSCPYGSQIQKVASGKEISILRRSILLSAKNKGCVLTLAIV